MGRDLLVEKYIGEEEDYTKKSMLEMNLLAAMNVGKMPGDWGKRLGTFGTVLARALKDAGVQINGIESTGKFTNDILVTFKGKPKRIKLDMNSNAASVIKKITTGK